MNNPKYIAIAAITLDGRIAPDSHHPVKWTSKEDSTYFQKELAKFDAFVVGTNTFNASKEPLLKRNTIVLTSSVKKPTEKYPHVWFVNYKTINLNSFINKLGFKKICVLGGSKAYSYSLEKKLLSEIYLTLEPVVFGKGISLFDNNKIGLFKFKLTSIKRLNKNGALLLKYKK